MAVASYQLEHFYYGQFVRDGKPFEEARLLARSNGVSQEQAEAIAQQVTLPPFKDAPDAAWALVRGKSVPFLLVQTQLGEFEQLMMHFVLLQSDVLRALGGNLDALKTLVEPKMPTYDRLGDQLAPLNLPQTGPPPSDAQVDHILDLMTFTNNRVDVIESLLSAVVQGVQLVVQNAPAELEPRIGMVKGLLALLPPPARFGVTYTTYSKHDTELDAQIRFYSDDKPPSETLVFNWQDASISGNKVEDAYSHFIISQLRLDADLVIQETQALTAVAAWRIRQGDTLAQSLAYASQRRAVDRSVRNNLPVEIDDVSEILAHDPTLDDESRRIYANHLLSLSLAMDDMQHADPVGHMLRRDPDLERMVQEQLQEAVTDGKTQLVYESLARWLGNPMGPQGREWIQMAHRAALAYVDQQGKAGDTEAITAFLKQIPNAEPGVEIERIVPKLVEIALPLSLKQKDLAQATFLLAVRYLESNVIMRLLESSKYLAQLPSAMGRIIPYLKGENPAPAPEGLLVKTSEAFGPDSQPLVLIRLVEAALNAHRGDMLEGPTLAALVQVADSKWGMQYIEIFRWIVEALSSEDVLPTLDDSAPFHMLQILLLLHDYKNLVQKMLHFSRNRYAGDLQIAYAEMLERLFVETSLPLGDALDALSTIEVGGVRSLPLALARIGVLQSHPTDEESDALASQVMDSLNAEPTMLDVIPPRPMSELLRFYIKREDVAGTARVASLIPEAAVHQENAGIILMIRMYKALDGKESLQGVGLEALRRYVRQSDTETARKAIVQFGRELGLNIREALEATYAIKRVMSGVDFIDYSQFLNTAADLLEDTAMAYADKNSLPTLGALVNTTQSLSGGLMDDENEAIANAVMGMGRAVIVLGDQYRARIPRDTDRYIDSLLEGQMNPRSGLDILWIMGGYFAKGKRFRMRFHRTTTHHPLGERSAQLFKDEAEITSQLLRGIAQAFPPDKEVRVTAGAIRGEIESLWGVIDESQRKDMVRNLAIDCQRIAQTVSYIEENGDPRALQLGGTRKLEEGKQQPKNTLEFYRYVYGYFKVK